MLTSSSSLLIILPLLANADNAANLRHGETKVEKESILDTTCLLATVTGGTKDACTATEDEDNQACVWCDAGGGQGICLTSFQGEIAEQFGISCGGNVHNEVEDETEVAVESEAVDGSILDYTCLLATVTGGTEDACTGTEDQDDQACVWCDASADQGLCLTSLQAEIAEQFGISCSDENNNETESEVAVESEAVGSSILDTTCLLATVTGGTKDACTATEDEDNQACVWCDAGGGQGICLTSFQGEIAEQFGISCSDKAEIESEIVSISR